MGIKAAISKPFAAFIVGRIEKWKKNAVKAQHDTLMAIVSKAKAYCFW